MYTERQIAKLQDRTLELIAENEDYTDAEREFAEKEIKRRDFDRAEIEARYGVALRDDDSLAPLSSYAG